MPTSSPRPGTHSISLSIPATVRIHVDKGIVTLTGNVRLPVERVQAQDVVRGVKGVRRIVNNITVGLEAPEDES